MQSSTRRCSSICYNRCVRRAGRSSEHLPIWLAGGKHALPPYTFDNSSKPTDFGWTDPLFNVYGDLPTPPTDNERREEDRAC